MGFTLFHSHKWEEEQRDFFQEFSGMCATGRRIQDSRATQITEKCNCGERQQKVWFGWIGDVEKYPQLAKAEERAKSRAVKKKKEE